MSPWSTISGGGMSIDTGLIVWEDLGWSQNTRRTPMTSERARHHEGTNGAERSTSHESTSQPERAIRLERTVRKERQSTS